MFLRALIDAVVRAGPVGRRPQLVLLCSWPLSPMLVAPVPGAVCPPSTVLALPQDPLPLTDQTAPETGARASFPHARSPRPGGGLPKRGTFAIPVHFTLTIPERHQPPQSAPFPCHRNRHWNRHSRPDLPPTANASPPDCCACIPASRAETPRNRHSWPGSVARSGILCGHPCPAGGQRRPGAHAARRSSGDPGFRGTIWAQAGSAKIWRQPRMVAVRK